MDDAAHEIADNLRADAYSMLYERLKKLSFLLTGNDARFLGEDPRIEQAVEDFARAAKEEQQQNSDGTLTGHKENS